MRRVRQQLGSAYGLPFLLAAEVLAGALSYALALRLLAPELLRDGRSLILDLMNLRRNAG